MNDTQLLRYSRHILLDEIGVDGQEKLLSARALIIGAGGLGSPAALYLAAAGVGSITIADADSVDLTNLQRQVIHDTTSIGRLKVDSAARRLAAINPDVAVVAQPVRVGEGELKSLVARADVVLDCSDNFTTRHAINAACVAALKPLVSGAAMRFDGQVSVFDARRADSPCYHCLFGGGEAVEETRCATMGVFSPAVGIIGSTQAAEALKLLTGVGEVLVGRLLLLDALGMRWRELHYSRDPECPVCRGRSLNPPGLTPEDRYAPIPIVP